MRGKKLLSLLLALTLLLSLAVPALAADQSFPDVEGHWAKEYIDDMLRRGMVNGYNDGLFHPGDLIVESTGLALCGRLMTTKTVRAAIAAHRAEEVNELIPDSASWFRSDAAACLEQNIVTADELTALAQAGRLNEPMTKADFSVYLVRAMGLTDLAQPSLDIELSFEDAEDIDEVYAPFVYLLSLWGVLEGDENGNFNPNQPMTRAVCVTMLSRALTNVVEGRGVSVEFPGYDAVYPFAAGTIQSVDNLTDGTRELKLLSPVTGLQTISLPTSVPVYQYNKKDNFTALKEGAYAKVCYAADGKEVTAIRVTPQSLIDSASGSCGAVSQSAVVLGRKTYTIDRFTQVSAGGKTGDPGVIDTQAGYTAASLAANSQGRVLWLLLSGGTRKVDGILTDVTTETVGLKEKTTLLVTSYNGMPTTYQADETLTVTVDGEPALLKESYKGRHVTLRVSDEDQSKLQSVDVNMTDRYIQGILRNVISTDDLKRADILLTGGDKPTPYELSEDCAVGYMGASAELKTIPVGSFVTGKVEGGTLTTLSAWHGYEDTEGVVNAITLADPTVLEVTTPSGSVTKFSIPLDKLPSIEITTKGSPSDITKLRRGDEITVTCLYSEVTRILFTSQEATVSGTVDAASFRSDGTAVLTILLSSGEKADYTATATTSVAQGGAPVALNDVRVGAQVALVLEGEYIASISISGAASSKQSVEGTLYQKDDKARTATLLVKDGVTGKQNAVVVSIPSNATILDVNSGNTFSSIARLNVGDLLELYGSYGAGGVFTVTSGVRK